MTCEQGGSSYWYFNCCASSVGTIERVTKVPKTISIMVILHQGEAVLIGVTIIHISTEPVI